MWILLNNQPVCVFNIKKVSGIIALTPELFYMDNNDIRKESVLSHIYSDAYKLYRQEVERALSLITEEDRKNPKDSPAVKAYEKALMGTKHIFGWYFKIQLDGGTTLYSSLYPSEEYAAQIRDSLLQTINKVTAELPKITI
jgi:hypothetical protein|nr:MAG TPA: hypothetical protein [Caudoviricetes sp.]